jgi:CubicO group peptidase (beta-lactamase class C family)
MFLAAEAVRSQLPGRPTWESVCREWLLDPIGAETMTFMPPTKVPLALTPQPDELPWPVTPSHFSHLGHPGGGIFGRPDDIIKVLQLHLDGGVHDGRVILDAELLAEMHCVRHRNAILEANTQNRAPDYEPFGLGWRIKLNQQNDGYGLGNGTPEGAFGHAGIWTVMGVGLPQKQLAIAFVTTHPISTLAELERIRNGITDLINDAYT